MHRVRAELRVNVHMLATRLRDTLFFFFKQNVERGTDTASQLIWVMLIGTEEGFPTPPPRFGFARNVHEAWDGSIFIGEYR